MKSPRVVLYYPKLPKKNHRRALSFLLDLATAMKMAKHIPMDVKVGDIVLFAKYGGTEIKIDGKKLLILRESDLLAIVTGK